jgi:hypothetical protein
MGGQLHGLAAIPPSEPQIPIGQEVGWAAESVCTLLSTDKSVTLAGDRSPAFRPTSPQAVSVPPELP